MALFGSSNTILDVSTRDTSKLQTHMNFLSFGGLKANLVHDLYLDGVLYNWAAKPFGGDLGSPLISNGEGKLEFYILTEFYFAGAYSFDTTVQQPTLQGEKSNEISYQSTSKVLELKAPGSYAHLNIPVNIIVTSGDPNTLEAHSH